MSLAGILTSSICPFHSSAFSLFQIPAKHSFQIAFLLSAICQRAACSSVLLTCQWLESPSPPSSTSRLCVHSFWDWAQIYHSQVRFKAQLCPAQVAICMTADSWQGAEPQPAFCFPLLEEVPGEKGYRLLQANFVSLATQEEPS